MERIRMFLRQLAMDSLMTNAFHQGRHFSSDPYCSRCSEGLIETGLHAVRDCPIIQDFWSKLVVPMVRLDLLLTNLKSSSTGSKECTLLFGLTVHFLWWICNEEIFQHATLASEKKFFDRKSNIISKEKNVQKRIRYPHNSAKHIAKILRDSPYNKA